MVRQRLNKEALALLKPEVPSSLSTSDLAVWRKLTEGVANCYLLQFGEADRLLGEGESLARQHQPQLLGEVALRQGTLAFWRQDTLQAEKSYQRSLQLAREQRDPFLEAAALGSLGLVATKQEHYDESIEWNRAALQLSESVGARDSIAYILGNMGWSYFEMGDYESALELFRRADETSARAGSPSAQVDWKINIGNVLFEEQKFESAGDAYRKALSLASSIHYEQAIVECFENLAFVDLEAGNLDSAKQYNSEVVQFVETHPDHFLQLYSDLIAGRIEQGEHDYGGATEYFSRVARDPNAKTSVRWQAQARLAEVYAVEGRRTAADSQFRQSLKTIGNARTFVKTEEFRLSFLSTAISLYADYIEFLISQGKPDDALQVAELSRARTLAEGLAATEKNLSFPLPNFHPRQIAQRLGATILFYWLGEKHSYLWAITPRATSFFTLPPAAEIDSLVLSYRQALVGPRDVLESDNPAGRKLYEILVAPAKDLIPAGSPVAILPDGSLYGLNFEALVVPTPKPHYWIEDMLVTNANSLLLLSASLNRPKARSKKLLLVGDPVSPNQEFPKLPQASTEMALVERYFDTPNRKVLSGSEATPGAYMSSQPAEYSFVHFVAHGTASRTSPLDSAVILTRQGDSYKLYARDILKQPLHADLVTISACHGAGERTFSGEGLVGLTWAFLRAGAHGVVAALWEVNDASTPQLMDQLYAGISKGETADASLREAKLKLLHSGTVYRKPFYWAPFEYYRGS